MWRNGVTTTRDVGLAPVQPEKPTPPPTSATRRLLRAALGFRGLNLAMAVLHSVLFVVVLATADFGLQADVFKIQLYGGNVTKLSLMTPAELDKVVRGPPFYLAPSAKERSDLSLPVTYMVASFFAITALFHAGNAFAWYRFYRENLADCACPSRWLEYSITASVMIVIIGYSAGVVVDSELASLVALTVVTMAFGHLAERNARPSPSADEWTASLTARLLPHMMGVFAQFVVWVLILMRYSENAKEAPAFVTGIVITQLALFCSFGVVQFAVLLRAPSKYVQGEVAYVLLSLVSKATLGLILVASLLHFNNWECAMDDVRALLPSDYC